MSRPSSPTTPSAEAAEDEDSSDGSNQEDSALLGSFRQRVGIKTGGKAEGLADGSQHTSAEGHPSSAVWPRTPIPCYWPALGFPRLIAACHILIHHAFPQYPEAGACDSTLAALSAFGYAWVTMFMVLSGFNHTLHQIRLRASFKPPSEEEGLPRSPGYSFRLLPFLKRRLVQLYPAYIIALFIAASARAPTASPGVHESRWSFVGCLFLVQDWYMHWGYSFIPAAWFLSAVFWIWVFVFPGFLKFILWYKDSGRGNTGIYGMMALMALAPFGITQVLSMYDVHIGFYSTQWFALNPVSQAPNFLLGMLLAVPVAEGFHKYIPAAPAGDAGKGRKRGWCVVLQVAMHHISVIAGLAALVACFLLHKYATCLPDAATAPLTFWVYTSFKLGGLLAPIFCLVIAGLAYQKDPVARLFGLQVRGKYMFAILGGMSYEIYIFHEALLKQLKTWFAARFGAWYFVGADYCVVFFVAVLAHFILRPAISQFFYPKRIKS